jgi:hypothetical protein
MRAITTLWNTPPRFEGRLPGMDWSIQSPHAFLYAPSRKKGSKDAFFWDQKGEALDPLDWIENGVFVPQDGCPPINLRGLLRHGRFDERKPDNAIKDWESVGPGRGE